MQKLKMFLNRNTDRILGYRLRSFFNLSNNRFDNFFSKSKFRKYIFKIFYTTFSIIKFFLQCKADIHSTDFNLTTSCNLRCKDCGSLMPYYTSENQWTINLETFKQDLDNLLKFASKIYRLKLIGGEPLLVKDLEKMLDYACSKEKIVSVIITTNSTIIPSDELCSTLKKYRHKALVEISYYEGIVSGLRIKEIEEKLKNYNIYYFISNYPWFEKGEIKNRTKTEKELIETYKNCFQQPCLSYFDGKLYCCTKAAAIDRLTEFKFENSEIINTRLQNDYKSALRLFYSRNFYTACNFCQNEKIQTSQRGIQTNEIMKISI